jgi:hypothetical protein
MLPLTWIAKRMHFAKDKGIYDMFELTIAENMQPLFEIKFVFKLYFSFLKQRICV